MDRNSYYSKNLGEPVYLPEASIGECSNSRNCRQFNVDLANGHCVLCWDRGIRTTAEQEQKRKYVRKVRKDISKTIKGRKSKLTHIRAGKNTWLL